MDFEVELKTLIEETGARFAIFCDFEGEMVARAFAEGLSDFDVRLLGAQWWTAARQLAGAVEGKGADPSLTVVGERDVVALHLLPQGYYLVVAHAAEGLWPRALRASGRVAKRFAVEL